jgi:hypothetical protein
VPTGVVLGTMSLRVTGSIVAPGIVGSPMSLSRAHESVAPLEIRSFERRSTLPVEPNTDDPVSESAVIIGGAMVTERVLDHFCP